LQNLRLLQARLVRPDEEARYQALMQAHHLLSAEKMQSLYDYFTAIPDPRRVQGRRHSLPTVLAISAAAVLCGREGYKAIWDSRIDEALDELGKSYQFPIVQEQFAELLTNRIELAFADQIIYRFSKAQDTLICFGYCLLIIFIVSSS
jgi:hypothetical protein